MSYIVGTHPYLFCDIYLISNVFIHIHEYESDIVSIGQ